MKGLYKTYEKMKATNANIMDYKEILQSVGVTQRPKRFGHVGPHTKALKDKPTLQAREETMSKV